MCDVCKKLDELEGVGLMGPELAHEVFALVEQGLKAGGDPDHLSEVTARALGMNDSEPDPEAEAEAFKAFERKRNR